MTLGFDLAIALNTSMMDSYYLDQVMHKGCWVDAMGYFNITSLVVDIGIDQIAYLNVAGDAGELENDVAALIDNVLILISDGFGELTTNVIASNLVYCKHEADSCAGSILVHAASLAK